jgi:hypothetical protein
MISAPGGGFERVRLRILSAWIRMNRRGFSGTVAIVGVPDARVDERTAISSIGSDFTTATAARLCTFPLGWVSSGSNFRFFARPIAGTDIAAAGVMEAA